MATVGGEGPEGTMATVGGEGPEENKSPASVGFRLQFKNRSRLEDLHAILRQIAYCSLDEYYGYFASVVNASGWGKSRTLCELGSLGVWVIYCSMAKGMSTFPPRSTISDYFLDRIALVLPSREGDATAYWGQHRVMEVCLSYYRACLRTLKLWIEKAIVSDPSTFVSWLSDPEASDGKEGEFWKAVQVLMELEPVRVPKKRTTAADVWSIWENGRVMLEQLLDDPTEESNLGPLKVVFVFDEARALIAKVIGSPVPAFVPVRRSTRFLRMGMVSVFTDTNGQVGNFAPPGEADPSDRVEGRGIKIPFPVYGTYTSIGIDVILAKDVYDPENLVRIGRPLWSSLHAGHTMLSGQLSRNLTLAHRILQLARNKLLGGSGTYAAWATNKQITDAAALAVIGCRLAVDINPRCELSLKVSAAHMVSVRAISNCRKYVWTGWIMEPVLAEAAAQVMSVGDWKGGLKILRKLEEGILQQWVDVGYAGELAGRWMLLRAMDMTRCMTPLKPFPRCTVDEFIEKLVGKQLGEFVSEELLRTEEMQKLLKAVVFFGYWHKEDMKLTNLTPDVLVKYFKAFAGIVCYERTWGIDLILPAYMGEDEEVVEEQKMTGIFIQVRNVKDDSKILRSLAQVSPIHAQLSKWSKRPFLGLYINVNRNNRRRVSFHNGDELRVKLLNNVSSNISKGKLKALIEDYPDSVAATESGSQELRDAMKLGKEDFNLLDAAGRRKVRKLRKYNKAVYDATKTWLKLSSSQNVLVISGKVNSVDDELWEQVYRLAEAGGPDMKTMCSEDYEQQAASAEALFGRMATPLHDTSVLTSSVDSVNIAGDIADVDMESEAEDMFTDEPEQMDWTLSPREAKAQ